MFLNKGRFKAMKQLQKQKKINGKQNNQQDGRFERITFFQKNTDYKLKSW